MRIIIMFRKTFLALSAAVVIHPAIAMARPAPFVDLDELRIPDFDPDFDGFERDTMAMESVVSAGADTFHWYRNDSIDGDTFDIDCMATNTAAPFQITLKVEGSWDFEVHSATAIYVYTVGTGTASVSAGTLTLGDGDHVIYNDTAAGGSELHIDIPGPAPFSAFTSGGSASPPITLGSGSGFGLGSGSGSMSSNPLWDEILAEYALVEWGFGEERMNYRFVGNNEASTLTTDLHQPGGSSDIDVYYLGDASCSSIAMPSERVESTVSVSSGHHYLMAGQSGDGPWALEVEWGPTFCDEDLNRDGQVDVDDLIILISALGACS
jgi:hypothetical protein